MKIQNNTYQVYRKSFWTLLFFLLSFLSLAQQPPPHLKVKLKDTQLTGESLLGKYQFSTLMFRGTEFKTHGDNEEWVKDRLVRNTGDDFVCIFLYGETTALPRKGDLFRLSLKHKASNEIMDIFVRVSYGVRFNEEITINIPSFRTGTYYMDMCSSRKKYQIPPGSSGETSINIDKLKKHRVSINKLKRLFKKDKCLAND